jgi:hypothetical protein
MGLNGTLVEAKICSWDTKYVYKVSHLPRPTTVQMLNLALIETKEITVYIYVQENSQPTTIVGVTVDIEVPVGQSKEPGILQYTVSYFVSTSAKFASLHHRGSKWDTC